MDMTYFYPNNGLFWLNGFNSFESNNSAFISGTIVTVTKSNAEALTDPYYTVVIFCRHFGKIKSSGQSRKDFYQIKFKQTIPLFKWLIIQKHIYEIPIQNEYSFLNDLQNH